MDFDDPHFLMYQFWIDDGTERKELKVYLDGTFEGFPPGTAIGNNASSLVGYLRAIIRKQNRQGPLISKDGNEGSL